MRFNTRSFVSSLNQSANYDRLIESRRKKKRVSHCHRCRCHGGETAALRIAYVVDGELVDNYVALPLPMSTTTGRLIALFRLSGSAVDPCLQAIDQHSSSDSLDRLSRSGETREALVSHIEVRKNDVRPRRTRREMLSGDCTRRRSHDYRGVTKRLCVSLKELPG